MNKPVGKFSIETDSPIDGFFPNKIVDNLLLRDFLHARCIGDPDLCDHTALCECEGQWFDATDGLLALDSTDEAYGDDFTEKESAISAALRIALETIKQHDVKYQIKHYQE